MSYSPKQNSHPPETMHGYLPKSKSIGIRCIHKGLYKWAWNKSNSCLMKGYQQQWFLRSHYPIRKCKFYIKKTNFIKFITLANCWGPDRLLTGSYYPGALLEGSYDPGAFLAGSYHLDALLRCQDCRLLMMTTITTTRINGLAVGSWERSCKY